MVTRLDHRKAFVQRLNQACDDSPLIPPHGQGRYIYMADKLGCSREMVNKWFKAIAMPNPDMMQKLADLLEVDYAWLALGIAPELTPREKRMQGRESDGAVHLVWGMMSLAGAFCGAPGDKDPRAEYVDFYATVRGTVYPVHVTLAREVSKDHYELNLPREHRSARCIAVMPAGPSKYHFIDLADNLVQEHVKKKGASASLTISRVDSNRYHTGSAQWPRIKSFGELR